MDGRLKFDSWIVALYISSILYLIELVRFNNEIIYRNMYFSLYIYVVNFIFYFYRLQSCSKS